MSKLSLKTFKQSLEPSLKTSITRRLAEAACAENRKNYNETSWLSKTTRNEIMKARSAEVFLAFKSSSFEREMFEFNWSLMLEWKQERNLSSVWSMLE